MAAVRRRRCSRIAVNAQDLARSQVMILYLQLRRILSGFVSAFAKISSVAPRGGKPFGGVSLRLHLAAPYGTVRWGAHSPQPASPIVLQGAFV